MHTSVINLETLNRISNIFPCVIWKDYTAANGKKSLVDDKKKSSKKDGGYAKGYFDKNTDIDFHQQLNDIVANSETDYEIVVCFYDFKKTNGLKNDRKKIFDYLLPPEEEFFQINNNQNSNLIGKNGIYYYFNEFYIENKFDTELYSIIKTNLNLGSNYPLCSNYYNNDWICYYNNNGPRFTWDKTIDWKNFGYSVNTPWNGFEHFCQYSYTLIRIGFEQNKITVAIPSKSSYAKAGMDFLSEVFNLKCQKTDYNSRLKKTLSVDEYEDSDYACLLGNMNYGIERTKTKKDVFYIKDFEDTKLEINQAKAQYKYEKQHVFTFSPSDKIFINFIYDKYSKVMPKGTLNNYSYTNFTSRYDELNKILSFIQLNDFDKRDEKRIKQLQSKIAGKIKENNEEKIITAENEESDKQDKINKDRFDQSVITKNICIRYGEKFTCKEFKYKEWINTFIEGTNGVYEFLLETEKLFQNNQNSLLVTEYLKLVGGDSSCIPFLIEKFTKARNEIMEEYNDE